MRLAQAFLLCALLGCVSAQNLKDIQAAIPACATNCSAPSISGLTCSPTTVAELAACLCPDSVARRKISACVQKNCNYTDIFLASKPQAIFCANYPVPSRSEQIRTTAIVLLAVTIPFLLLRGYSRLIILKSMWWDDYILALSSIILIANLALNVPLAESGLGKHAWHVNPKNFVSLAKMFYFAQIAYVCIQVFTKLSILLLFLRIFPQKWFRNTTIASIAFVVLHGVIFLLLVVFRCLPIRSAWDRTVQGRCINTNLMTYIGAGYSIFEDLFILALPIPCLKSLKITLGRKIGLAFMFSIGSLACVTSMVRLNYLDKYGDPTDPTWDNVDISIWSVIENAVAVICACLPALRPFLSWMVPQLFGTSQNSSQSGLKGTENSGKSGITKGMQPLVDEESHRYSVRTTGSPEIGSAGRSSAGSFTFIQGHDEIELDAVRVNETKRSEKGGV